MAEFLKKKSHVYATGWVNYHLKMSIIAGIFTGAAIFTRKVGRFAGMQRFDCSGFIFEGRCLKVVPEAM